MVGPAGRSEDLARLGTGDIHLDGPDARARQQVRLRAAVADVNATVRPSGLHAMSDTPQSPEVTWRGIGAGRDVHDEQVRPAIEVADAVPAPVRPGDPPADGRGVAGSSSGWSSADGRHRADQEPRRIHLGGERQPAPVRRPGHLARRTRSRSRAPADPATGRSARRTARAIGLLVVGQAADERHAPAVRARCAASRRGRSRRSATSGGWWRGFAPGAATEIQGHDQQVRPVPIAPDDPSSHDREAAVGGHVVLVEDDLSPDVRGCHRRALGHGHSVAAARCGPASRLGLPR